MPPKRSVQSVAFAASTTGKCMTKKSVTGQSMEETYLAIYTECIAKYGQKTAVLMMVGQFYEFYDSQHIATGKSNTNIRQVVDVCGGSVEGKPTNSPDYARLFWGFPDYVLPKYERLLVAAGYTVVVVDQIKDGTGKVIRREISYVSSPGTYLDTEASAGTNTEDRYMVGVTVEPYVDRNRRQQWSVASSVFDVQTGAAFSSEASVPVLDGVPVLDPLLPFWDMYAPAEVAVWYMVGDQEHTELHGQAPSEQNVCGWFRGTGFRGPVHVHTVPTFTAAGTRGGLDFLHRLYNPSTALTIAEYLGVSRHPAALTSLVNLLRFVEEHNPSYLHQLRVHQMWDPKDTLALGNAALEQLAMVATGTNKQECLLFWLQHAQTAVGRRALRARCMKPITDVEELDKRQDRIQQLRQMFVGESRSLTGFFHGIADIAKLYRTFQLGRGTAATLTQLLQSYVAIQRLASQVVQTRSAAPQPVLDHIDEVFGIWDLERIRAANCGSVYGVGPHHPWRRGVHPVLDHHEDQWTAVCRDIQDIQHEWSNLLGEAEDAVKMEFKAEEEMFVFTATKRRATSLATVLKQRKKIELGVHTRGVSATTATLTAPVLTELNEKARDIWRAWLEDVGNSWKAVWSTWSGSDPLLCWLGTLDTEYALAGISEAYGYERPRYVEADLLDDDDALVTGLVVKDLRHPIVERVHAAVPYIPHSLSLGSLRTYIDTGDTGAADASPIATSNNGILLYGVNAAGKSTLSKALGLAVLMAQIGMPVPASAMTLVPYTHLYTRILGNDNLWAGMSSFVVEMTEFRSILRAAGPRMLVLGDELCSGTETISAAAIVGAGIQTLQERGVHFVFATHLHELMDMPEIQTLDSTASVKPYHLTVTADPRGFLVYDRKLREGSGSPIYGLEVCRGLDMDAVFMKRAVDLRKRLDTTRIPTFDKASRYNAALPVQVCHVCGANTDLEVHHIVPQVEADEKGNIRTGLHKNSVGNLAVLCETCHDKHHRGDILIQGWVQTSHGRVLDVLDS